MSSGAALAYLGYWLTYLIRSGVAYLLLWSLCKFIKSSHLRFRLYGIFLAGMAGAWLGMLWLPALLRELPAYRIALPSASPPHWSLPANSVSAARLALVISHAPSAYLLILTLLFIWFLWRSWQRGIFLRFSEPPSMALSFLFELVRIEAKAPPCELRLVLGLRSPAATGWWRPTVLLSNEFLHRLKPQELLDVLRHELMHVRRRDYLCDRVATLACYLVFFHPAAWLVRRRLRWERELVCDEGVADRSAQRRLEYANCLTTLASWWFLEEELAASVDFLSSPPSLLATRVRALLAPPSGLYSIHKRAAITGLAIAAVVFAAVLVPEITVTLLSSVPHEIASIPSSSHSERSLINRKHGPHRRMFSTPSPVFAASDLKRAPLDVEPSVILPVLSAPSVPTGGDFVESDTVVSRDSIPSDEADGELPSVGSVWDESLPRAPRHPTRAKIGSAAMRVLRIGVTVLASRRGGHEHETEH
jgi:Zn-dependent protease with chaperone function